MKTAEKKFCGAAKFLFLEDSESDKGGELPQQAPGCAFDCVKFVSNDKIEALRI